MTLAPRAVIIGAGFTGLAAAFELARRGIAVTVLERDDDVGGLAGSFRVGASARGGASDLNEPGRLEKFYHHWFTSDHHITALARDLGVADRIVHRPTRTGMYVARRIHRLSTPADVLRFTPLGWRDRLRLGLLAVRARAVSDWQPLESMTAAEWLQRLAGREVYRVVWEPLLVGKFGPYADQVSAVWIWNKLKLRGGSRGARGGERLAYFRGGFAALARALADAIRAMGGHIECESAATALTVRNGRITGVVTGRGPIAADAVIATPALPLIATLVAEHAPPPYVDGLRAIEYLANVCIVLELDRSLSSTYWLNINDPGFPFVGVIEHTNFEPATTYGGRHIVYLSTYLPASAALYQEPDDGVVRFALTALARMFPAFDRTWISAAHVWRARYAQPVIVRHYSALVPPVESPIDGLFLATMAQVYPEDRGTNYAVRDGRRVGRLVSVRLLGQGAARASSRERPLTAGRDAAPAAAAGR